MFLMSLSFSGKPVSLLDYSGCFPDRYDVFRLVILSDDYKNACQQQRDKEPDEEPFNSYDPVSVGSKIGSRSKIVGRN